MPSARHAFLVDLFHDNPHLIADLLRDRLNINLPAYTEIRTTQADLTQLPPEYRADLVLVFYFAGNPVYAVILEVQLGRDDNKLYAWPAYVGVERARCRCPTSLVVVTIKEDVFRWAGQIIVDGNAGGISLKPIVLGPGQIPDLTPEQAAEEPEVYSEIIFAIFREACRKGLLETQMLTQLIDRYRDEFQGYYEEGKVDGRAEGKAEGIASGKAQAILLVLATRSIPVSNEIRQRILSCQNAALLDRWTSRAVQAASAAEVVAEN